MSHYSDVGNLMYLDLDIIESGNKTSISEYLIQATAEQLNSSNSRNWIPLIVKETTEDCYQVIGNSFVYAVAECSKIRKSLDASLLMIVKKQQTN